jgi:hypothetical protein
MSMMMPPHSIQLPPSPTSGQGRATSGDSGSNSDNLRAAIDALQAYIEGEQDDQDLAVAAKIKADLQKLLASQQQLVDQATGACPGARMIRRREGRSAIGTSSAVDSSPLETWPACQRPSPSMTWATPTRASRRTEAFQFTRSQKSSGTRTSP